MTCEIPKFKEHKVFNLFGIPIHCYVLEDNRRIISSDSLVQLFSLMAIGFPDMRLEDHDLDHFVMWCSSKINKPKPNL